LNISYKLGRLYKNNIKKILDESIKIKNTDVILDAGCGEGRWSEYFYTRTKNVHGLDYSTKSIEAAKQNIKGVHFIVGDLRNILFSENTFDIIYLDLVLQHILTEEDFKTVIKELTRVCKPEGTICFIELMSGIEKKSSKYMIIRPPEVYEQAFLPHQLIKHIGIRFPYFSHAMMYALKKIMLKKQLGDVRDMYAVYEKIDSSKFLQNLLLLAHWCSVPFTLLSREIHFLSPERLLVFKVKK
jgi:ubiquinone/menaquinone biosynthesis C-methylase UbiE